MVTEETSLPSAETETGQSPGNAALGRVQQSLQAVVDAATDLAGAMRLPVPGGPGEVEALCQAARRALEAPDLQGLHLRAPEWQSRSEELSDLLGTGQSLSRLFEENARVLRPEAWDREVEELRETLDARGRQRTRMLSGDYRRAQTLLGELCQGRPPSDLESQLKLLDSILEAQRLRSALGGSAALGERLFGTQWQGEESDWPRLARLAEWVQQVHQEVQEGKLPEGLLDFLSQPPTASQLEQQVQSVEDAARVHAENLRSVVGRLEASRSDLLDLSLRNQLLNYRLLRSRGLEVADESPAEVFRILVQEGRTMTFLPRGGEDGPGLLEQPDVEPEEEQVSEDQVSEDTPARRADTRLSTAASPRELQDRLLATYHAANSFIQEQGVNTLFLALGMMHWFESSTSQVTRLAPLVLIPVRLDRSSVQGRFRLRHTGEEVGENLSLREKARVEFGLALPDFPDPDDLDIEEYFTAVAGAIAEQPRWSIDASSVVLGFFSFNKFLMYHDLDVGSWPDHANPAEHPLIDSLLWDGFQESPPLIRSHEHLDQYLSPDEVHQVLDADGSQVLTLLDVKQGRNLVVQGPPGTGKSQTITNIIAEAIGQGRTVLFVSEKMAALEVVKRRLDGLSLGDACLELHSHKTTRKAVVEELARTLDLGQPRLGQVEDDFNTLSQIRDRLNGYCDAINTPIGESGVTPYQAMGELLRLRQSPGHQGEQDSTPLPNLPSLQSWSGADFRRKQALVEDLELRVSSMGVPREHAFWGSRRQTWLPSDQDHLRQSLVAAQQSLKSLEDAAEALARALRLASPSDPGETAALARAAQRVLDAPEISGFHIRTPDWLDRRADLDQLLAAGSELAGLHQEHDDTLLPGAWDEDVLALRESLNTKGRKWWRIFSGDYKRAKGRLAGLCRASLPSGLAAQVQLADAILVAQERQRTVRQFDSLGESLFRDHWQREDSDWPRLTLVARWVQQLHEDINAGNLPGGTIAFLVEPGSGGDLRQLVSSLEETGHTHARNSSAVAEVLDLDVPRRFPGGEGLDNQPFHAQKEALDTWLSRSNDIHDMVSLNTIAEACRGEGLDSVVALAEEWPEAGVKLVSAFRRAWFEDLLERAFRERRVLNSFDGTSHEQMQERFRELDRLALEHNRARLAYAHWQQLPRQGGVGQIGVLRREFEKRRRHLPVRQLMAQAGNAIQAIKPVFMMSPLSIAAFLPPGSLSFDLVIFDEASQVRPVDALGAIMRGRQAVVVGDSQQLPPTNFFDALSQGSDVDEENVTADIESILGLFASQGAPDRMLSWHYRSRHESLIMVSNSEFYRNSLTVFPSPDARRQESGLRFRFLPEATYDRGGSKTNDQEAEAVARAVMDHAHSHPDLTLGVAAFSVAQMQTILDRVEALRRRDPTCEGFFNGHPHEPFFVKNLENVQGDERDVMLLSIGYGRDPQGRIDMNFGPLNWEGGERRLNVLITRARLRCEVFTNLQADDIDLSRTSARGVQALKTFLAYAQGEDLESVNGAGHDSTMPFEEVVASALAARDYEIQRQVGMTGFAIDLAVVDPEEPGRYLLGIQCDGPSYQASRSARDRDRLREQVLASLGWRLHRVWSAEWFRNPQRELQRLVDAIESARSAEAPETADSAGAPGNSAVERDVEEEPETRVPEVAGYRLAELDLATTEQELPSIPEGTLAEWVAQIVEVESPVHVSEVTRRLAGAVGVRRLRRNIQSVLNSGIEHAVASGRVLRAGDFLWSQDMEHPVIRDRSALPAASRKPELVPPEEVALAVTKIAGESYGITEDEVTVRVARLLGFPRVTEDIKEKIQGGVRQLLGENRLVSRGGQLFNREG